MMIFQSARWLSMVVGLLALGGVAWAAPAAECLIAEGGKARLGVQVSSKADPRTRDAAKELAAMFTAMSGADIAVATGDDATVKAVLVGTVADFPDLPVSIERKGDFSDREAFQIHSEEDRVFVVGLEPLGVQNGVWALLHELGFRQFYPGKTWEIIPRLERLSVKLSRKDRPDYFTRRIVLMVGRWGEGQPDFAEWQKRNLAVSGFDMAVGHSWGRIVKRHEEEFAKHPEYLVDPEASLGKVKFQVANEGLRELVVKDALHQFHENPGLDCVALDPSDGGGWPESSPLGSVSNQVVTLANTVVRAFRDEFPDKRVTFYGYHRHSPPPTIQVEPEVIVNVATAFMTDGWSVENLLTEWGKKGASLGIRDYFTVLGWDSMHPGRSRASNADYLATNFPAWHRLGARYYETEASDSWGPYGLGYYLAQRLLWDVDGAGQVEEWIEDFFEKSFGTARAAMKRFFENLDGKKAPLFSEHLLGKMYRELATARKATTEPAVLKRIDDYIKYVRYLELYRVYKDAPEAERQATFDECVKFAYRIRDARMIAPGHLNYRESRRDRRIKEVTITPLRKADQQGPIDVDALLANGIANNQMVEFEPISYGGEWEPPKTPLAAAGEVATSNSIQLRGENELLVYLDENQRSLKLTVKGGLVRTLGINIDRGPVRFSFIPLAHPLAESVADAEVPADREEHTVELSSDYTGLHRLLIQDGNDLTELSWEPGSRVGIPSGWEKKVSQYNRNVYSLLFFVPKGTRQVVGYATSDSGWVEFPDGTRARRFREVKTPGYFNIAVPKGMDGKVWRLAEVAGERLLLNVPPMLFRSPEEMLVPAELE